MLYLYFVIVIGILALLFYIIRKLEHLEHFEFSAVIAKVLNINFKAGRKGDDR